MFSASDIIDKTCPICKTELVECKFEMRRYLEPTEDRHRIDISYSTAKCLVCKLKFRIANAGENAGIWIQHPKQD